MKKIFLLLFLVTSTIFSQEFNDSWKKVYKYEIDGKTKTANEIVNKIYKKAKRKNDDAQIVKCFFYNSKFLQVVDENAQQKIISNLLNEIKIATPTNKAILNYVYGKMLQNYYSGNYYIINKRNKLVIENSNDFYTWTINKFNTEIEKAFEKSVQNEEILFKTKLIEYKDIFDFSLYKSPKTENLYSFLSNEYSTYLKSKLNNWEIKNQINTDDDIRFLFGNSNMFINHSFKKVTNEYLLKIIELLKKEESLTLKYNPEQTDTINYNRISFFKTFLNDKEISIKALNLLEKHTTNIYLKQQLKADRAKYLYSLTEKDNEKKNYYNDVLKLVDSILNIKINNNALYEAEQVRNYIIGKSLSVQTKSVVYQNENCRAAIQYKNIDTIKISYYKIPFSKSVYLNQYNNNLNKDSIVLNYIKNKIPVKSFIRQLPIKKDYFQYSCEVLLEKFDIGNYLVFIETRNELDNNRHAFCYTIVASSNINYISNDDKENDYFYVFDRKTGKPLENITVKNNETSKNTNSNGKASFSKKQFIKDTTNLSEIYFTKENDTLIKNYYKGVISKNTDKEIENFDSKSMVYFDRAIYRPGQKVNYKGYIFQNKKGIKSVVPFVTVHLNITNPNNDNVSEFDIQTNEFGSFTGEFLIPKNSITGEFELEINEPDEYENDTLYYDKKADEHSFWDNVDFDWRNSFEFKVEEYKRPTFEITFDKIKENYTIGDKVTISGNAKSLAGSNLTNAKVNLVVFSSTYCLEYQNNKQLPNFINKEIETDSDGNFKIEFSTKNDSIPNDIINEIHYDVTATITDINGETRTANNRVIVSKKTLKLETTIDNIIYKEDENLLNITSTTLNDYPSDSKGTIKIYFKKINKTTGLFQRQYYIPEIETFTEDEFKKLFPYEFYNNNPENVLIATLNFDTKISKSVNLKLLKTQTEGYYNAVTSAFDSNNNEIISTNNFTLKSRFNKKDSSQLYTFNVLNNPKNDEVEVEFYSIIPKLNITTFIYNSSKQLVEKTIELKDGYQKIKFNIDKKEDLYFLFYSFFENNCVKKNHTILKENNEKKLEFEIVNLRNKIEPGSKENWSFKIKNSKLESEVLANMYDSSLDLFATQNWDNIYFDDHANFHEPQINVDNTFTSYMSNLFTKQFYFKENKKTNINWFGFSFNNPNDKYASQKYFETLKKFTNLPENSKLITGIVSDATGPLPGANVIVMGTSRGTQTNFDGYFEIEASEGENLEFSFIGLRNQRATIGENHAINVKLNQDEQVLDEVVVTAFGIKRSPKELTYATQKVSSEELVYATPVNAITALAGKVSGLNVVSNNQSTSIVLRGYRSMSGDNEALIVVDGVIVEADYLNKLPADQIENIAVLKSGSATALYGSQGKNGAVVITTKNTIIMLSEVKTRSNFNETAFFYPNLKTDSDGKINFNFTTPESLTKWKLQLFAHNKKTESGYFEKEIISQKDLMIMPNMPRFVREKDKITISAKVANMTTESKSGIAMLQLFDAVNNSPIDEIALNKSNIKNFNCKPKESIALNWDMTIPAGIQGIQYKIVAKSGDFSDGEENIIPVLSNSVLVTESIPVWVKGNTKKEYSFSKLLNLTSTTLKNHSFTFEYTSNPTWLAIQSLPYLLEFQHECAEQTFARYYSNSLATAIIESNPKILDLLESWKNTKTKSKLNYNDELKSIILEETPWLLDVENEENQNKKLAMLLDLKSLKESNEQIIKNLEDKILPSGGFPWFSGGNENLFITQHIVAGLGHLDKLFPNFNERQTAIIKKAIPYMDAEFLKNNSAKNKIYFDNNLQYLYARSFYLKKFPLSKKIDSLINVKLIDYKKDWLTSTLYEKGLLTLIMNRYNNVDFAKKIITHLKESSSNNVDIGMYWIENKNGYYWYNAAIETQALLIEAFGEVGTNKSDVDEMKVWLIKNKQSKNWPTTKSTTEAIYALLLQGSDWLSIKDNTKVKIGDEKILTKKLSEKDKEAETGYIKLNWNSTEIKNNMGEISIENKTSVPGFGGVYWQYFENLENIESSKGSLSITKTIYKKINAEKGEELVGIDNKNIAIGDLLTIRLIIKSNDDLEFVHLKDLRASSFEPVNVISKYYRLSNTSYYMSTKDVATHFFFDSLPKGTYVLEYDVRITNKGEFNSGNATIQSMYSPEFTSNSSSTLIKVAK
jgi:TonB-dependent SusC/RagA subfamily outer membrane receptor